MCNITLDKIKWFQSRSPAGNWRKFSKIKILYTLVTKEWSYDERIMCQKFLVPHGMTKTLVEVWQSSNYFHSFNVLPGEVKDELGIDESRYDSKMMKLELSNSGSIGIKQFWYVYCVIC